MKRSEINAYIAEGVELCRLQKFHLPPWAFWTAGDWKTAGHEADEIRRNMLGWDVTDFGSGDFLRCGLLLFTIRNGRAGRTAPDAKDYCEKLLIVRRGQRTPTHFHWSKMEDIINRGGGPLVLEVWNADHDTEALDETGEVTVSIDGIRRTVPAGGKITLTPGESITIQPYLYHCFYGGDGPTVLAGEVSRVNDDANDNRFLTPLPRFPAIEEDQPPLHLLCTEYPPAAD